jgi:hypothetical protein
VRSFCKTNSILIKTIAVDSLEKAKSLPSVFNNWAVWHNGRFASVHLLNEGLLKKMLGMK